MSSKFPKILFITWDGPQTSYMEGLFLPIFNAVQQQSDYQFHVIQFTWGTPERLAVTQRKAHELGITYTAKTILRKPNATFGSVFSLFKGIRFLNRYVKEHEIDIVMPRSTLPAFMVNRMGKGNFKILFDADGLALDERVDFSGLSRDSRQYRFLKSEEEKMLRKADSVITRSQKAIEIHLKTIGNENLEKFSVVSNGRNTDFFKPDLEQRTIVRSGFACSDTDRLFVYCGSLGAQYGWREMLEIFSRYHNGNQKAKFLILTGNPEFTYGKIPELLNKNVFVKKVPFEQVPNYLSAADVAFAIREPKYSMQGVAPIKLGEYLLMGLPTIASAGIGDSEDILTRVPDCFLFRHDQKSAIANAVTFVEQLGEVKHQVIREYGIRYFSMEKSAVSYIQSLNKLTDICSKSPQK